MIKLIIEKNFPRIDIKINWELIRKAIPWILLITFIIKIFDEKEKPKPLPFFTPIIQVPKKRKDFPESTKKETRLRQGFVCNLCKKQPEFWEYHHKDGNRANNSPYNCEGLCPLCHAKKTRKKNSFF